MGKKNQKLGLDSQLYINLKQCYHGTNKTSPELIYQDGFNPTFSKEGNLYGNGIYFSQGFGYASKYAYKCEETNQYKIIICMLALGNVVELQENISLKLPPFIDLNDEKKGRYDSIQGTIGKKDVFKDTKIIVMHGFGSRRAYPLYEVSYTLDQ